MAARRLSLLCVMLALTAATTSAQMPAGLANPGFEENGLAGWHIQPQSQARGYQARVTDQDPHSGQHSLEIRHPNPQGFGLYGRVTQTISAELYRSRRIRFRAAVRPEVQYARSYAALYTRVLRPGFAPGHACDMAGSGIRTGLDQNGKRLAPKWQDASVVVDVAPDAEKLEVGFLLNEAGAAWFDDAAIELLGRAGEGNEPPRPLAGRGLENLIAFTRLFGYVRYFHPSDEATALSLADWDRFAIDAINVVEPARSPEELAALLRTLFAPLAPTAQVFPTAQPPAPADLAALKAGERTRVVGWMHTGGASNYQVGSMPSRRVTDREDLPGAPKMPRSPVPLTKPEEVFAANLGGGISCRLLLTLCADAHGTRPKATARLRPPTKPADFAPTGDDRATRLGGIVVAWNIFQHFYPYFEEVRTDWPAVLRDSLTSAATDADAAAYHLTLRRLVAKLYDGHAVVRGGSGVLPWDGALPLAWDWIEDKLVVVNTDPAHAGRVNVGDIVTAIDGTPTTERMRQMEALVSGATPQFVSYRAMQDLRNGAAGQPTMLTLQTLKGESYTVTLTRQPADDSPLRGPGLREARLPRCTELKSGYFYVDLDRFHDDDLYTDVLPKLARAKGVVFDVRGYPTVSPEFPGQLTDHPLSSEMYQTVVTLRPDHRDMRLEGRPWTIAPANVRLKIKAAFLTDGRAVSYAETFMALVARHKLGPIIGGPTSGTNGGVNLYILPDGSRVSWTAGKARKLDGSRHHGIGVLPDVAVRRTVKAVAEGRDELVEKALELIRQQDLKEVKRLDK